MNSTKRAARTRSTEGRGQGAKVVELVPHSGERPARKPIARSPKADARPGKLPPGLHPATVERKVGGEYVVRSLDGERYRAALGVEVEAPFVEECIAERRTILMAPTNDGIVIVGALQVRRQIARDAHDGLRLEGKRVEIEAADGISFRVGKSTLRLERDGLVRVVGQRMTMDFAEVVKILSAACELP